MGIVSQSPRFEECVVVLGGPKGKAYHVEMNMMEENLEIHVTELNADGTKSSKRHSDKLFLNQFDWSSQGCFAKAYFALGMLVPCCFW